MYSVIILLIILIEILIASWIIYLTLRLDAAVVAADKSLKVNKNTVLDVLIECRGKFAGLNKQASIVKEEIKIRKMVGIFKVVSLSLLLKNKLM